MKLVVDIKVSNATSFDELVNLLHDDYQFNRKRGYLGTPFDYVKSAICTFPMILKFVNHENLCKAFTKCHQKDKVFVRCKFSNSSFLINGQPVLTHYYNIILALNIILTNGIKLKFQEGDILFCSKSGVTFIILKNNTIAPCYKVRRLMSNSIEKIESYDSEFVEENFIKIGVVEARVNP